MSGGNRGSILAASPVRQRLDDLAVRMSGGNRGSILAAAPVRQRLATIGDSKLGDGGMERNRKRPFDTFDCRPFDTREGARMPSRASERKKVLSAEERTGV